MSDYPKLASPVTIGPLALRNRVIQLPHGVGYAVDGLPGPKHLDFYRARARGGVAMVCVETSYVSPDGGPGGPLVLSSDSRATPGYSRIAEAIHQEGALVQGQLSHWGNQSSFRATRHPLVGPSHLPDVVLREPAVPMSRSDMDRIRDDFAAGARVLRTGGFDSVELKVGHDGLLRQFLSPLTNDRDDEYGGSLENRIRYVLEVAEAVRHEIGSDVGLSARLCLDECYPGGYGLEVGLDVARAFAGSGLFSHITPTLGVWGSMHHIIPPMTFPEGYAEYAFAAVTKTSGLPVIAVGLIQSPEYAERLLGDPGVAAVGMARELLAEPEWANKVLSGRASQIRPCTACNDLCLGNVQRGLPVSCTVNPQAGHGETRRSVVPTAGHVVVVGGGPAGMEAARTAAEDGCDVVLLERSDRLGGRLALAGETGGRVGWQRYLSWLKRELVRLGVDVRLNQEATAADVRALAPQAVVIACGSEAQPSDVEGVVSIEDFLRGPRRSGHVVLADMGAAGMPLWSAALEAATRGAERVTLVTPAPAVGSDLDWSTRNVFYRDLSRAQVRFERDHVVVTFADSRVGLRHVHTDAVTELRADVLVGGLPRAGVGTALVDELHTEAAVRLIGDALSPREASAAIREGQEATLALFGADGLPQLGRAPGDSGARP